MDCVGFYNLIVFTIEEFSQIPIRGRSFLVKDLAANYLGILTFGFWHGGIMAEKKKLLLINENSEVLKTSEFFS